MVSYTLPVSSGNSGTFAVLARLAWTPPRRTAFVSHSERLGRPAARQSPGEHHGTLPPAEQQAQLLSRANEQKRL